MNVVIDTQRLEISEIRDVRTVEVSPNNFVTVADVVLEGASLPISVDVTELNAVDLASALDLDPQAEARETERDTAWVGELVEHPQPSSNLQLLIASGAVDANGNLKPYKASGHKSVPMTLEELGDDGQQYPY